MTSWRFDHVWDGELGVFVGGCLEEGRWKRACFGNLGWRGFSFFFLLFHFFLFLCLFSLAASKKKSVRVGLFQTIGSAGVLVFERLASDRWVDCITVLPGRSRSRRLADRTEIVCLSDVLGM